MNIEEMRSEISRLDPDLLPTDEAYRVAMILLASVELGAETSLIAQFLDIRRDDLKTYETNLRQSGIWVGQEVNADWSDAENGGLAFWLDVSVAMGTLTRRRRRPFTYTDARES